MVIQNAPQYHPLDQIWSKNGRVIHVFQNPLVVVESFFEFKNIMTHKRWCQQILQTTDKNNVVELISMLNPMDQLGHYWYLYNSAAGRKGLNLWLEIRYSAQDSVLILPNAMIMPIRPNGWYEFWTYLSEKSAKFMMTQEIAPPVGMLWGSQCLDHHLRNACLCTCLALHTFWFHVYGKITGSICKQQLQ